MQDELSLSTTVFGRERAGLPFEKMADLIAEAGYRHIEISRHHDLTGRTETVGRAGLRVWSIHGVSGAAAVSPDESLRRRQVDDECRRIEALACFAPAPYVVHYVDRYLDREYGRRFRRSLEEIHAFAARFGLTVAVETAPYKPQENERYPDSAEIAAFVRSFAAPDLRMTIDINHSNLHEALDSVAANCDGLIANVHLSDNNRRYPGNCGMDFPKVIQTFHDVGYDDLFCTEIFQYPSMEEAAKQSIAYLAPIFEKVYGRKCRA